MSPELRSLLITSLSTAKFMVANTKFPIGKKLVDHEVLTQDDLLIFEERVKKCKVDGDFELSQEDLLLFYTALEVSIKCFLSEEATKELKQISIKHNNSTPEQFDTIRKFYLTLAGRFIEGIRNDYRNNKAFQQHLAKLEAASV